MYRATALFLLAVLVAALAGCGAAGTQMQVNEEVARERGGLRGAIRAEERKTTAVLAAAVPKVVESYRMMQRQAGASEALADEYVCILVDAYKVEIEANRPIDGGFVAWSLANLHIRPYKVPLWKPSLKVLDEGVAVAEKADALPALFHASCAL